MTTTHGRPLWAEVSRSRLAGNFEHLRRAARLQGGGEADVLAVVKAGAYGHGAALCAPVLAAAGAQWLGVTSVEEGVLVRTACSAAGQPPWSPAPRILVMCGMWRGEAGAALDYLLTPVVWETFHLDALEEEARRRGMGPLSLGVHLEIDSGMARQGVRLEGSLQDEGFENEGLKEMLLRFDGKSPLRMEGVLTHFASPEVVDSPQNGAQLTRFQSALSEVRHHGLSPEWVHAGNSATMDARTGFSAVARLARTAGARAMARPGLALYGCAMPLLFSQPLGKEHPEGQVSARLQPVLAWKTRIVSLRDVTAGSTVGYNGTFAAKRPMRLALLPVGYADGLRRELSGSDARAGGEVLIRGHCAPIVGRISMDLTVVDVSAIPEAAIGDETVLIGEQGRERITAEDHARLANTIPYEVLCGISERVPRIAV